MKLHYRSSHFVDAAECDSTDRFAIMREALTCSGQSSAEPVALRSLGSVDECGCLALVGRFLMWANRNAR